MKVKVESEEVGLKLNIQKMKILASGNMTALFQTVLMRLALCGLAASLVVLALRSRIAVDAYAWGGCG